MPNTILPYDPKLKALARQLRTNGTFGETLLWMRIKSKALGPEFHRQVPIGNFIVDFFCHELMLAIEIDGGSHDEQWEADTVRQSQLEGMGVRFIRFTEHEVKAEMVMVLEKLGAFIDLLRIR